VKIEGDYNLAGWGCQIMGGSFLRDGRSH
jgi:hypothetical protein